MHLEGWKVRITGLYPWTVILVMPRLIALITTLSAIGIAMCNLDNCFKVK